MRNLDSAGIFTELTNELYFISAGMSRLLDKSHTLRPPLSFIKYTHIYAHTDTL